MDFPRQSIQRMSRWVIGIGCAIALLLTSPGLSGQRAVSMTAATGFPISPANEEEESAPQRPSSEIAEPRREVDYVSAHHAAGQRGGPSVLMQARCACVLRMVAFLSRHFAVHSSLFFLPNGLGTPLHC